MTRNPERIILGRVAGIHGINGWIKVISYTRPRENILDYGQWWIGQHGEWRLFDRTGGRPQGKGLVAALAGVTERDTARELVGAEIAVERSVLPDPAPGEYYWYDLIGLQVQQASGDILGRITALQETGASDVLVVQQADGKQELIPYVPGHYILDVDLDAGTMTVDWPMED